MSVWSTQAFCRQLGGSMGTWLPLRLGSGVGKLQGSAHRSQRSSHSQQSKRPGCNICSCIARPSDAACLIPPRGQAEGTLHSITRLPEMIHVFSISRFHAIYFLRTLSLETLMFVLCSQEAVSLPASTGSLRWISDKVLQASQQLQTAD